MCGIVGSLGPGAGEHLEAMVGALEHRGPDGDGIWRSGGVALGASRLAILDSAGSPQPLVQGGSSVVANAEIYNHRVLRAELEAEGCVFQTGGDTEVILHGYLRWGRDLLERLNGSFAFALWDAQRQRLILARDRFGIAPMVWAQTTSGLVFASEVKGLLAHPEVKRELDPGSLDDVLCLRYVPGARTLWRGIEHLPPGHVAELDRSARRVESMGWAMIPRAGSAQGGWDLPEAIDGLEAALTDAVGLRALHGEAPVGLYLSGGLDSTLVGALAASAAGPLPAWTHGFDPGRDETERAQAAADHAGHSLRRIPLVPEDLDALPALVAAMEQPVTNPDGLGLWVLAREASRNVKAVLCGEGADELFASYPHQQLLERLHGMPDLVRKAGAAALGLAPAGLLTSRAAYGGAATDPEIRRRWQNALRAPGLAQAHGEVSVLMTRGERESLYSSGFGDAVRGRPGAAREGHLAVHEPDRPTLDILVDHSLGDWLTGYHLGRENRIAMAHGIEARYPFLDPRVVQAVVPLPLEARLGAAAPREKFLLREVAKRHLPPSMAQLPKGPVLVPLEAFGDRWHELIGDLLSPERVRRRGIFEMEAVESLLSPEKRDTFLGQRQLFGLAVVETWFDVFEM